MIAAWIVYCALWTLWLSAMAWVTERLILAARGPVRMVWLAAMLLSVVGPVIGYSWPRDSATPPATSVPPRQSVIGRRDVIVQNSATPRRAETIVTLRDVAARADRPLSALWIGTSLVFLVYLVGGVLRLRVVRRRWRTGIVDGTPVMISENTGPALVGVFETTIVIPAWALELDVNALALMLRHEREHRAAGDTRTLAIAQGLLALMPWNPLLWWQLRRLRLGIEIDCDARVLRHTSDVATYGRLLLEFGQQRGAGVGGAALADHHASQLEARIRRMTRRAPMQSARVIAASIVAASVAIAVGCQLPTPPAPAPHDATRSIQSRTDSATLVRDTALGRWLDTADARDRELIASANRELERQRRAAETKRPGDSRLADPDLARLRNATDSLPLKLFEAQIALLAARDSADRLELQKRADDAKREFDSLTARLAGERVPVEWRRRDSLDRELFRLRQTLTDEHPLVKRTLAQLRESESVVSDSALAADGPSCGVDARQPTKPSIKFIVSDNDLSRLDRIDFTVAEPTGPGTMVDARGMSCHTAVQGEIRLSGYGAFFLPITIRTAGETSLIVVTGSGRVLAGPIAIKNEARRYQVPLPR